MIWKRVVIPAKESVDFRSNMIWKRRIRVVIPAKAGIQWWKSVLTPLDPGLRRGDGESSLSFTTASQAGIQWRKSVLTPLDPGLRRGDGESALTFTTVSFAGMTMRGV